MANSTLIKSQFKIYGPKEYAEDGTTYRIKAKVRYDDECNNGHNTFSITGEIDRKSGNRWVEHSGGCIHDEIAKHFPELKPFIKWHLVSSDSPLHYIANTLYHAGNRDCWGKVKGEPYHFEKQIAFEGFPITFKYKQDFIEWLINQSPGSLKIHKIEYVKKDRDYSFQPKYTFFGFGADWYDCPFDNIIEAEQFLQACQTYKIGVVEYPTSWGEGKEPDLEGARDCAIWPDATLAQLNDKKALEARLPALMAEFKKDVESLGFIY